MFVVPKQNFLKQLLVCCLKAEQKIKQGNEKGHALKTMVKCSPKQAI